MTDPSPEEMALNQKRNEFIGEEAHEASLSWELWHLAKGAGTADSEIVKGGVVTVRSRILELAGTLGEATRGTHYHDDGFSGGFYADGYTDPDTGDIFYFYPAHRVHSWWEGVDQRLNEAGFPPDYLTDEMRESIHREISSHIT